jgi:hypothetical protein
MLLHRFLPFLGRLHHHQENGWAIVGVAPVMGLFGTEKQRVPG